MGLAHIRHFITTNGSMDDHVEGMFIAGSCIHRMSRMYLAMEHCSYLHKWLGQRRLSSLPDSYQDGNERRSG